MKERRKLWRTFKTNQTAVAGTAMAIVVLLIAVFAFLISPYDPLDQDVFHRLTPPERAHPFGTDEYGRDVLSRIIWGTRVSLTVGFFSVLLGMVMGTAMGVVAGYSGGATDTLIMRMVDVLLSFPTLITGIMIAAILGSGLVKLIITIGIVFAPRFARIAYGPTLAVKEMEYVSSAKVIGASGLRVILCHIIPNIFGEIIVAGTLWMGTAIMTEASLSFLGLGVSPPTPTWGNMIRSGIDVLANAPWLSLFPGLSILITVLAFNMIGDGLRDIADPKLRV
ncbi:MAG: ABC transporter permease [Deltaproteobacteria bacterium]|nr:ABC transporter permease [Deltaproteobacteria bacterium]MBW1961175.1 ABC transporter permease [Deltaproteobacteria bacterium]MBW1993929.1 ABC transporter permease [Deltaproteobacteria bacterium]MBW2151721.1 ABC transporter permease [Deltaproteobacteria bacterium]